MKIKVLKPIQLDFEGERKDFKAYDKGFYTIEDSLAIERNYVEIYAKYPDYIKIEQMPRVEQKKESKKKKDEMML